MRIGVTTIAILLVSAATAVPQSLQPVGWDNSVKLAGAVDINADPHIVEINLKAEIASVAVLPGVRSELWTYNGGLPGPLIRARVGDRDRPQLKYLTVTQH